MIQDIAPHIYHNEYKPSAPDKDSFILTYENGRILLPRQDREEAITFPRFQELEGRLDNLYVNYIYLFSIDDQRFYLIPHLDTALLPDYEFQDVRVLRTAHPQHLAFAGITGHQLVPVVQQSSALWLLRKTNDSQPKRTYDGMPFLWQSRISGSVPCCYCGDYKWR